MWSEVPNNCASHYYEFKQGQQQLKQSNFKQNKIIIWSKNLNFTPFPVFLFDFLSTLNFRSVLSSSSRSLETLVKFSPIFGSV